MLRVILTSVIAFIFSQYIVIGNHNILPKKISYIFYNILSVFCLYTFLNIFLWQYEVNFLIVATFLYILSIAMYYVHEFRGTNLNFSDIASINTAKEVAGGYTYVIKKSFVYLFALLVFEYIYQIGYNHVNLSKYYFASINGIQSTNLVLYRLFWHELIHIILFLVSFFILRDKISAEKFDYSLFAGENEGYIFNFVSSIPIFHKKKITDDINIKIYEKHSDVNSKLDTLPHIIVIMNESFGTLQELVNTDNAVTPFYDSIEDVIKGNLYVNTFGGGTANTEFEFLTGMTVGNIAYPVMPYNNFVKSDKYTLATYLKDIGYETIGMHPYTASNYHRDRVYKYFGFEKEIFIDDMDEKTEIRNFVSDESMYKEVIKRYEDAKKRHKNLFLFGVTVQNHSGYENLPEATIYSDEIEDSKSLDSYMSLMNISDSALKFLIEHFKKEKEHVIILFFGDHNASFGTSLNKKYFGNNAQYEFGNAYKTPFMIYDNKKKNNERIDAISANFLSLELLKAANIKYDDFHVLLDDVYKKYSAYNFHKALMRKEKTIVEIPDDMYMKYEREYLKK